ncbi:MAG: hypothetical protein Q7S06_01120 [Nanoarchaeota archaeon]|nr:hypothetical protein [Nanoarchaeota archaeon]
MKTLTKLLIVGGLIGAMSVLKNTTKNTAYSGLADIGIGTVVVSTIAAYGLNKLQKGQEEKQKREELNERMIEEMREREESYRAEHARHLNPDEVKVKY